MSAAKLPAARRIARFYTALSGKDLPETTRHAVRRHMLDTLGVGIAGAAQPEPEAVAAACRRLCGGGGAPLWGARQNVPSFSAALINGAASHALELDDASGCDHSGAVMTPALMAALPLAPHATDDDLIAAFCAGYDLGRRVMEAAGGYDAHNNAGWHSTGTCGVFGASIAVSRLLGVGEDVATNALGIAGSFSSGNWSFMADGAMTKRLHAGHAAAGGLMSVELARGGLIGPEHVFDTDWGGFFSTYCAKGDANPELLTADLGNLWRIHRSSIKPYASCRGTHAAVEIARRLAPSLPVTEVERISIHVTATIHRMCGGYDIRSLVDAQMSLPYAVAVAWLTGEADLSRFLPPIRGSEAVAEVMRRIEIVADPSIDNNLAARVLATRRDGVVVEDRVDVPEGSWNNPLPDTALIAKYHSLATPVIGRKGAEALHQRIFALGGGGLAADIPPLLTAINVKE